MCTSYYFDVKHSDNNYDTTAWSEAILLVHKINISFDYYGRGGKF